MGVMGGPDQRLAHPIPPLNESGSDQRQRNRLQAHDLGQPVDQSPSRHLRNPGDKPARFFILCGLVRPDALVEIDSIANIGQDR